MRGVSQTGVLRRYKVGDLVDIGGGGWFVRIGGEGCAM